MLVCSFKNCFTDLIPGVFCQHVSANKLDIDKGRIRVNIPLTV